MALVSFSALPCGPNKGANNDNATGAGVPEGQQFVATRTGTITTVALCVGTTNTSTNVHIAIYDESGGEPQNRLGPEVILASPIGTSWNYVSGFNAPVVSGTNYWVIYLAPNGGNAWDGILFNVSVGNAKDSSIVGQTTLTDPATATWGAQINVTIGVGVMGDAGIMASSFNAIPIMR